MSSIPVRLRHSVGTVALAKARARWTYPSGYVSDHERQFGERGGETSSRSDIGSEVVEASSEVLDERMAGHDDPGGTISFQPSHRSKPGLQAPVVGLERVVGVGLRVMEGRREQLIEDPSVDPVPVGGDLDGRDPSAVDRLGEEPPCCRCPDEATGTRRRSGRTGR